MLGLCSWTELKILLMRVARGKLIGVDCFSPSSVCLGWAKAQYVLGLDLTPNADKYGGRLFQDFWRTAPD